MTGSVCQTHAGRRLKSSWPRPETPSNCGWAPQRYAFSQKVGPKKRGRAGKRKSPSGVFYTAILEKKKPGTERHPHPRTSLQAFCELHKITSFFLSHFIPARNFSKRSPKRADTKTFVPKSINCTSRLQKACESEKNDLEIQGPGPGAESVDEGFYRPKSQKTAVSCILASIQRRIFPTEARNPRPERVSWRR